MIRPTPRVPISLLVTAIVFLGCEVSSEINPIMPEIQFMKNGGGGGKDEIKVRAVDPDTAFQGQSLDLQVNGSGFDDQSEVSFEIDGQPTSDIDVQATTFVNERKLTASIAVDSEAAITKYDVVVESASRGKKGIGLELLEIKSNGSETHPLDFALNGVVSVGVGAVLGDAVGNSYVSEEVDVSTQIDANGAMRLRVDTGRKKPRPDRRICLALRTSQGDFVVMDGIVFDGSGAACVDAGFVGGLLTEDGRQGRLLELEEGESERGRARFLWGLQDGRGQKSRGDRWLRFGTTCERANDAWVLTDESERVTFTRTATGWEVSPNDPVGYLCVGSPSVAQPAPGADPGGRVHVELRITATEL